MKSTLLIALLVLASTNAFAVNLERFLVGHATEIAKTSRNGQAAVFAAILEGKTLTTQVSSANLKLVYQMRQHELDLITRNPKKVSVTNSKEIIKLDELDNFRVEIAQVGGAGSATETVGITVTDDVVSNGLKIMLKNFKQYQVTTKDDTVFITYHVDYLNKGGTADRNAILRTVDGVYQALQLRKLSKTKIDTKLIRPKTSK